MKYAIVAYALAVSGCAMFQGTTPAEAAATALDAVDKANAAVGQTNTAADRACDAYALAVVLRQIKADPVVSGRCNARILNKP